MGHPVIDEFCRIYSLERMRTQSFRRYQRVFRDEVQPMLDERERLLVEVEELRGTVERLQERPAKATKGAA